MAHGYLAKYAGEKATIYSAGVETNGVNQNAIAAMSRDGIDISNHTSNNIDEYGDVQFDFIITVCDNAKERCPYFPSSAVVFHENFPDPAGAKGTLEEIESTFNHTRDLVKIYMKEFVSAYL